MKISIVTAVFNRVDTIGQAIKSVQSQIGADVEHVIKDGGSTDGTVAEVESRIAGTDSVFISAPDSGIYDALNQGVETSSGDIIGLMHSDDFFADTHVLAKVAKQFEDPKVQGVYGDLDYVSALDTSKIVRRWRSGPFDRKKLSRGWMPPHPTLYLRRDVFETWGAYDTSYRISADYDAILRWLWDGQIRLSYIPEVMVKMRVGGESNRSLGRILQKSREDYRALKTNGVGGAGVLLAKNLSKIRQFLP